MHNHRLSVSTVWYVAIICAVPVLSCTNRGLAQSSLNDSIVLRLEVTPPTSMDDFGLSITVMNNSNREIRFGYSHLDMILPSGKNPHFNVFLKQSVTDSLMLARRPRYDVDLEQLVVIPIAGRGQASIYIPSSWFIDKVPFKFDTIFIQYSGAGAHSSLEQIATIKSNECNIPRFR